MSSTSLPSLTILLRRLRTPRGADTRPAHLSYPKDEQILLLRRLAVFLRAHIPLLAAIQLMREEAQTTSAEYVLLSLERSIARGRSLSQSLAQFESIFGAFTVQLVHIGEISGTLPERLGQIASSLAMQRALRRKVVGALIYPAIIVCATIGITAFLTVYAFPKMLPILRGFRGTLPLPTRILVGLSTFLSHYGWLVLAGLVCIAVAFSLAARISSVRRYQDRLWLHLPILGRIVTYYQIARLADTLATMLRSGTRILPALLLTQRVTGNMAYQEALGSVAEAVRTGKRLSESLRSHAVLFPSHVCHMVGAGETTGTLLESFESLCEYYTEELDEHTRTLTTLIEPILMIAMGLVVGFVALAIITPIYGITATLTTH